MLPLLFKPIYRTVRRNYCMHNFIYTHIQGRTHEEVWPPSSATTLEARIMKKKNVTEHIKIKIYSILRILKYKQETILIEIFFAQLCIIIQFSIYLIYVIGLSILWAKNKQIILQNLIEGGNISKRPKMSYH